MICYELVERATEGKVEEGLEGENIRLAISVVWEKQGHAHLRIFFIFVHTTRDGSFGTGKRFNGRACVLRRRTKDFKGFSLVLKEGLQEETRMAENVTPDTQDTPLNLNSTATEEGL